MSTSKKRSQRSASPHGGSSSSGVTPVVTSLVAPVNGTLPTGGGVEIKTREIIKAHHAIPKEDLQQASQTLIKEMEEFISSIGKKDAIGFALFDSTSVETLLNLAASQTSLLSWRRLAFHGKVDFLCRQFLQNWHRMKPLELSMLTFPSFLKWASFLGDGGFDKYMEHMEKVLTNKVKTFLLVNKSEIVSLVEQSKKVYRDRGFTALSTIKHNISYHWDHENGEAPWWTHVRVAAALSGEKLETFTRFFQRFSSGVIVLGTPSMKYAGLDLQCTSSCYLVSIGDSWNPSSASRLLKDILTCMSSGGGMGIDLTGVDPQKPRLFTGNFQGGEVGNLAGSPGIENVLKLVESTVAVSKNCHVRPPSAAVYCELWHSELLTLLDFTRSTTLQVGIWIPLFFFELLRKSPRADWCFFAPKDAGCLRRLCGKAFEKAYQALVDNKAISRTSIPVEDLLGRLLSLVRTGKPYLMLKDACVDGSNFSTEHGNLRLDTNLCCEVVLATEDGEEKGSVKKPVTASCNLGSISVLKFTKVGGLVGDLKRDFDWSGLAEAVRDTVHMINVMIDETNYPSPEIAAYNKRYRPLGIGIQGFTDACQVMDLVYGSRESQEFLRAIWMTVYYYSLHTSIEIGKTKSQYQSWTPFPSKSQTGWLHPDVYNDKLVQPSFLPLVFDWASLRKTAHLAYNVELTCQPPTATSGHTLGLFHVGTEPNGAMIHHALTAAGQYLQYNQRFLEKMEKQGILTPENLGQVIKESGYVERLDSKVFTPEHFRPFYSVYHYPLEDQVKALSVMAPFVTMSTSFNWYLTMDVSDDKMKELLIGLVKAKAKTLLYYIVYQDLAQGTPHTTVEALIQNTKKPRRELVCVDYCS